MPGAASPFSTITFFGDVANSGGALVLGLVAAAWGYSVMYLLIAAGALGAVVLLHSPFMAPVTGLRGPRSQPATA